MSTFLSKELTYRLWNETASSSWRSFYKTLSYYWGKFDQIDQDLLQRIAQAVNNLIIRDEPFPETPDSLYSTLAYEI